MGRIKTLVVGAAAAVAVGVPTGLVSYSVVAGSSSSSAAPVDVATGPRTQVELKSDPFAGQKLATRDFPTNSHGQTSGTDADAETLAESPDLVAVAGDHGRGGYVLKEDLAGPTPNSPDEAGRRSGESVVLKVYDQEGDKVVDTFTLLAPADGVAGESP